LCAPYQPRLDYKFYYAGIRWKSDQVARIRFFDDEWVGRLVEKLKSGDDAARSLLRADPFPKGARYVRVDVYRYAFTSYARWRRGEGWWERELVGRWPRSEETPVSRRAGVL
jgi:hypothetical protein